MTRFTDRQHPDYWRPEPGSVWWYALEDSLIEGAAISGSTELDLSNFGLTALPPELWQLTGLQALDLSANQLTTLPPEIGQLTSLQALDLHNNDLTALPPELCHLENLKNLVVSENPLPAEYPDDTGALLEYLCQQLGDE